MRFEVIHVITLFAGLKQERYNACPHKAVCMNSFVLSESKAGRYLSLLRTGETAILWVIEDAEQHREEVMLSFIKT